MTFKSPISSPKDTQTDFILFFKVFSMIVSAIILSALIHPVSAFSASPDVHAISGRVTASAGAGMSGVTMTLSGAATSSVTTDASGNYTFSSLPNGSYKVAPAKTGYAFSPAVSSVTLGSADQTGKNFSVLLHAISVTAPHNSLGLFGVEKSPSGGATLMPDTNWGYAFSNLLNVSNPAKPPKSDHPFDPTEESIAIGGIGLPGKRLTTTGAHSISGTIIYNGARLPGITMVLSLSGIISEAVTTDANGEYNFKNLRNETYTVTPSKPGYTFSPEDRTVTVNGSNRIRINFGVQLYSISGTVTFNGAGLSRAIMHLSGAATTSVMTDSSGNYTFANLLNGDYAVTPAETDRIFTPENTKVTITGASPTGIDFASTVSSSTNSISGIATFNGIGLWDVEMALSGTARASVATDTDGAYIFPDLVNGNYIVTPSKRGYKFAPESKLATVTDTSFSAKDFEAMESSSTYSISGTVTHNGEGLDNVTMRLYGAASAEVTTDKYGSYAFSGLPSGSYTISPRKSPYAFGDRAVTISDANLNKNFTATYASCSCEALSESGVSISVPSGTFTNTFDVTLSTSISGAQIRYTTNGQNPTASSNLYSGAISIASTTRLIAATFVGEAMRGYPSTTIYVKIDSAFQATTHDLPVIILDSYGSGALPTADPMPYVDVAYLAFNPADAGGTTVTLSPTAPTTPSVASLAAFHIHGNSSAMFDKKSYRLELRHETGKDRDCPMFGLWEDSDWALIGPYPDKSLIHNNFVYELGRDMGVSAPRIKLVEVYLNLNGNALANSHYQGVYQLVETIKNSKNRLNLKQLHADDPDDLVSPKITGGYIFKIEWMAPSPPGLQCPTGASNCWKDLYVVDPNDWPDGDLLTSQNPAPAYIKHPQYLYLQNYIKSFNDAINSASLTNPTTGYPAYIDEQSFIDTIIINELTRSYDGMVRSQYFHKQRDKAGETAKIFAGPLWDFDLIAGVGYASGNTNSTLPGSNFQYQDNDGRIKQTANWFPKLINLISNRNSDFSKHFRARWNALRQSGGFLSNSAMDERIDALTAGLANAAARNFERWNILNISPIPSGPPFITPKTLNWQSQIPLMKTWLHDRAAWLDTQWTP
jgi:hypothetical protein